MKQEWKTPLRFGAVLFGLYLAIHYWGNLSALASMAAGRETPDFAGAAPDSEIVAVKLRKARPFYRQRFCVPEDQEHAY